MAVMMYAGSNEVNVICRETIKPSSPTPHTHKTFKLSFLDQLIPNFYVHVILFYPKPDNDLTTQIQNLKTSFSETLSLYYPLAGQLDLQNLTVDCNDAGAQFVEARAHARMDDIIQDPQMDQLLKYLPLDPSTFIVGAAPPPLLAVQVSFFDCGGISIGVCSSHQLTDAVSLMEFIGSWAGKCLQVQNGKLTPPPPSQPVFALARHFPPRDLSGSGFSHISTCGKGEKKLVTKRYIFDTEKLDSLRRAVVESTVTNPTRVELVSAFIWRCIIEGSSGGKNQVSAAWHAVNLRPRIKSLPMESVFGNCILRQFFFSEGGGESHELVTGMRNGLKEVNEEFIWRAAGKDGDERYANDLSKCIGGEMEICGFSSWSRLPVYEMDFGMGKPVWVCPTTCPEKNVCFLMGTKDGGGIELWVNMLESTLKLVDIKFQLLLRKSQVSI